MLSTAFGTLAAKLGAAGIAGVATIGSLGAVGALPAPAQSVVSGAAGAIGVDMPSPPVAPRTRRGPVADHTPQASPSPRSGAAVGTAGSDPANRNGPGIGDTQPAESPASDSQPTVEEAQTAPALGAQSGPALAADPAGPAPEPVGRTGHHEPGVAPEHQTGAVHGNGDGRRPAPAAGTAETSPSGTGLQPVAKDPLGPVRDIVERTQPERASGKPNGHDRHPGPPGGKPGKAPGRPEGNDGRTKNVKPAPHDAPTDPGSIDVSDPVPGDGGDGAVIDGSDPNPGDPGSIGGADPGPDDGIGGAN
jgi:hypothetical protein